jgi:cytochrome P450 family 142 subfamily A polypeptide 1
VCFISKNNEIFCSGLGVRPNNHFKLGLIDEDEPRHGQVRRLINRGFTPRMVKKLEEVFRVIVKEAIDSIADKGECEFVESIAVPLPLLLIAEMIGIHKKDRERFHQWSDHMIAGDGNFDNPEIVARAGAAFAEYTQYCTQIIEDRRANPKDDLVSILVGAKDAGILIKYSAEPVENDVRSEEVQELAQDELIKLMVVLLVAGNETTRNGISAGMELLITHPEAREKLRQNPSMIPMAVEEMLRLASPIHTFSRTATRDTELHGKQIKKGDVVLMVYPSANRDPAQFKDPDSFKIDRNPNHVAFGIGNHFCLGANLARMEMRVAFEELLRRVPDMEFSAGGPVIQPSPLVRTCSEMRVRFTPESNP